MKIEQRVVSIVQANTEGQKEVSLASDLREDLHLDSFGTLMIINALEEAFGISFADGDFTGIVNVADIVRLLQTKYGCQREVMAA